jgi:predicted RNA methylase
MGLPPWLSPQPLLGPGAWSAEPDARGDPTLPLHVGTGLSTVEAADVATRLRGLWLDGRKVLVDVTPPLPRAAVREARLVDAQRRRDTTPAFTRGGTQLDEEGRYSLTPEIIALEMAQRVSGQHGVDLGAGAGGNAIGFARAGCTVTAIEQDAKRLALARHNARCYGVESQIRFVHADGVTLLPELNASLLFVDPPWGRDYSKQRVGLVDLPLLKAALSARARYGALWAKVPVSFVTDDTPQARPEAVFGRAPGDARRIKFLWLTIT